MNDLYVLEKATAGLIILVVGLGLYHLLFRRVAAEGRIGLLQDRLRYVSLGVVFLLPLYWLTRQLGDLAHYIQFARVLLYYFTLLVVVETGLCFLIDRPGKPPRIPATINLVLGIIIYAALGLVPLSAVLDLPLLDAHFQARLGSVFVLYLALHLSYTYVIKWLPWKHPLAVSLRNRLRGWTYMTLLALVIYYAFIQLNILPEDSQGMGYFRAGIFTLTGFLAFEAVMVCLFDYYFLVLRGTDVPNLFRDLARGLGYIAIVALSAVVFLKKDLSSLLLGSAVISVAVGFALQETLGNFFAGLALRLARPYTLGDRVEVMAMSGIVQKIDWRSTAMINNQGDLLIVPNSKLAQELIVNHSSPAPSTGRYIEVGVHYRHPPNLVKKIMLDAAYSVPDVLEAPRPEVYLMGFADSSVNYRLRVFIRDFSERFRVDSKVREAIWYHFEREGVEIPYPIRNVYWLKPNSGVDLEREVRKMLDSVDFFSVLDAEDLAQLTRRAHYQLYAGGEKVCVQGEPGSSFYIIKSGRLRVTAVNEMGETFLSAEMNPGQYFGEMALLTGEPRSATVAAITDSELIRLGKEDLRFIIRGNPQVEQVISKILAFRKIKTQKAKIEAEEERTSRLSSVSEKGEGVEQLTEQFLRRIREFFSY